MKCSGAYRYGTHGIPHKEGRRSSLTRTSFPIILVVVLFCNPTRNLIVNRLGLWPPDYIKEGGIPREDKATLDNQSNVKANTDWT